MAPGGGPPLVPLCGISLGPQQLQQLPPPPRIEFGGVREGAQSAAMDGIENAGTLPIDAVTIRAAAWTDAAGSEAMPANATSVMAGIRGWPRSTARSRCRAAPRGPPQGSAWRRRPARCPRAPVPPASGPRRPSRAPPRAGRRPGRLPRRRDRGLGRLLVRPEMRRPVSPVDPVPARDHIKITLLPRCELGWKDVAEQYGDVGVVDRPA